jgi:hypothetical protein
MSGDQIAAHARRQRLRHVLCDFVIPRIVDGCAPKRSEPFAPIYICVLFSAALPRRIKLH